MYVWWWVVKYETIEPFPVHWNEINMNVIQFLSLCSFTTVWYFLRSLVLNNYLHILYFFLLRLGCIYLFLQVEIFFLVSSVELTYWSQIPSGQVFFNLWDTSPLGFEQHFYRGHLRAMRNTEIYFIIYNIVYFF